MVSNRHATTALVFVAVSLPTVAAIRLPPINWGGSLTSTYRLDMPGVGSDSTATTNGLNLNANSFIWRPWFATWDGSIALTRANTESDSVESTSDVISGGANVRLFPRSHFPAQLYFSFSDTDLTNATSTGATSVTSVGGLTITRFGVAQQVTSKDGAGLTYNWRAERLLTHEKDSGFSTTNDFAQIQSGKSFGKHDFNGTAQVRNFNNESGDSNTFELLFFGDHGYQHSEQLSIENNADLTYRENSFAGETQSQRTELKLLSDLSWRDLKRPLTANASADFAASADAVQPNSEAQSLNLNGSVTYQFTPQLSGSGSVGVGFANSAAASVVSTSQSASLNYSAQPIDLYGFNYSWATSGSVNHQTSSASESSGSLGASIGHSVNRALPLSEAGSLSLSMNASQNLSSSFPFEGAETMTFSNLASTALQHQFPGGGSSLGFNISHIGVYSETDLQVLSVGLNGAHNRGIGRFMSLGTNFNMGYTQSVSDGSESDSSRSTFVVNFNHRRFLNVNRLRFRSIFDMDNESINPFVFGEDGANMSWRNDLDYSIGRVEASLTTTLSKSGDAPIDKSIFISTTRSF